MFPQLFVNMEHVLPSNIFEVSQHEKYSPLDAVTNEMVAILWWKHNRDRKEREYTLDKALQA